MNPNAETCRLLSILIAAAFLLTAGSAAASPRRWMNEGHHRFAQRDYEGAQAAFKLAADDAAKQADPGRMDPSAALYNMGKALFEQGAFEEAAAAFDSALGTSDLALQQRILFNRGNALVGKSVEAEQTMDPEGAIELMQEATSMYERSMALAPDDIDPKVNYELALQRLEQLKDQQQQQEGDGDGNGDGDGGDEGEGDAPGDQPGEGDEGDRDEDPREQPDQRPDTPGDGDGEPDDAEPDEEPPPPGETSRPAGESESMTEEEAEMLLNAMRDEEQAARQRHRIQEVGEEEEVEKNW